MRLAILILALISASCSAPHFHYQRLPPENGGATIQLCTLPWFVLEASSIPEPYRKSILDGFDYWDVAGLPNGAFQTVSQVVLGETIGPSGKVLSDPHMLLPDVIVVAGSSPEEPIDDDAFMLTTMGDIDVTGCVGTARVLVNTEYLISYPLKYTETAARHEAGHLLGLDHYEGLGDLMYPAVDPHAHHPIDASPDEINAVRRTHR